MGKETNQIIARLANMETSCVELVKNADDQKAAYAKSMEQKTRDFDAQLEASMQERLKKAKIEQEEKARSSQEKWIASTKEKYEKMTAAYYADHEKMAQEIFQKIISQN